MDGNEVEKLIKVGIPDARVEVDGEGCNFAVVVVSDGFDRLLPVKRQQKVLLSLKEPLGDGRLHAVSVKALTPSEWDVWRQQQRADGERLIQIQ